MKHMFFYISLIIITFFSCTKKESVFNYHKLKDFSEISEIDKMPIRYSALIKNDIVSIFSHYKETPQKPLLKENLGRYKFEIDKKGIYILSDQGRYLAYSFLLNENIERDKALNALFYNNVKLLEKKKYSIDSKEYEIYHFYESGNHDSVDSYYMVGVGFICFHEFQEDAFIYLNNKEALQVSEIFLTDSTFFSKSN